MPPKTKAKVEDAGKILKCFEAFDQNGDGTILKDELARVLRALDPAKWPDKKVEALMKSIDVNKDGKIDYDEFTRWLVGSKPAGPDQKAVLQAGEQAAAAAATAEKEGEGELDAVLKELFKCYDEDEDEQIERIELLDGEEKRLGKLNFGPKVRKEVVQWFKEAGAEGSPTDGMYLSEAKWKVAMVKLAATGCELEADTKEFAKLAAWIREQRLQPLLDFANAAAEAAKPKVVEVEIPKPGDPPPDYPLTCPLTDLETRIKQARSFGKWVLVLSSGLTEVETYLQYRMNQLIDCKQLINEVFVKKSKTKEDAQEDVKKALGLAMNSTGFCKPLHIRMANSAFDWVTFTKDCESLPADLFDPSLWTIDRACGLGYFDEGHKFDLSVENNKKWNDFYVLISSTYDYEKATEFLSDKIPHFDKFAVIVVDPASVEK